MRDVRTLVFALGVEPAGAASYQGHREHLAPKAPSRAPTTLTYATGDPKRFIFAALAAASLFMSTVHAQAPALPPPESVALDKLGLMSTFQSTDEQVVNEQKRGK